MASAVLEATRAAHEDLERLAVRELQREPANPRDRLFQSHRVRHMLDLVVSTSSKPVEIYEDNDNARKDEVSTHLTAPTQSALFSKYYERLKEEGFDPQWLANALRTTNLSSAAIESLDSKVVLGGGQDAMNVTMTDRCAGKFEDKFYHMISHADDLCLSSKEHHCNTSSGSSLHWGAPT